MFRAHRTVARLPFAGIACAAALAVLAAHAALDPGEALAASRAAIGTSPDPRLLFATTEGRTVALGDFRGKPLVVSFVYTACSQVCPTTTRFLHKAVREARRVVGEDAFYVVSIGFDAPADNPVSMRVFQRQHGIDDPRWSFLAAQPGASAALARGFGFRFAAQSGGYEHLTQVTVLDREGRLHAQVYGESFELPMLVAPLRELVLGEPAPPSSLAGVVERVRILCTVYDPVSGGYRLDWRLFIELGVGTFVLGLVAAFLVRERRRAMRP